MPLNYVLGYDASPKSEIEITLRKGQRLRIQFDEGGYGIKIMKRCDTEESEAITIEPKNTNSIIIK